MDTAKTLLTEARDELKDILNAAHNDWPYDADELAGFVPGLLARIDLFLGQEAK
jgi:hypothetical protein